MDTTAAEEVNDKGTVPFDIEHSFWIALRSVSEYERHYIPEEIHTTHILRKQPENKNIYKDMKTLDNTVAFLNKSFLFCWLILAHFKCIKWVKYDFNPG